jgi:uracil-DNA glycosylase
VQKLTEEQRQLLALEIGTMHESWLRELKNDITSPSFLNLKRFLKSEALSGKKIFPPSEDVYAWSVPSASISS